MLVCTNCESPQFLQITWSRALYDDSGGIKEVNERIECVMCGATGGYSYESEGLTGHITITGDIEEVDDRPEVSP